MAPEPAEEGAAMLAVAEVPPLPEPVEASNGTEPETGAEEQLPAVEALSKRVPAEVAATLDELFRVKWTGVRRVRPEDLKGD